MNHLQGGNWFISWKTGRLTFSCLCFSSKKWILS